MQHLCCHLASDVAYTDSKQSNNAEQHKGGVLPQPVLGTLITPYLEVENYKMLKVRKQGEELLAMYPLSKELQN